MSGPPAQGNHAFNNSAIEDTCFIDPNNKIYGIVHKWRPTIFDPPTPSMSDDFYLINERSLSKWEIIWWIRFILESDLDTFRYLKVYTMGFI